MVLPPPLPEPSKDEINLLRNSALRQLEAYEILSTLDHRDVTRFKTEDAYVSRFLLHHDKDQKLAQKMAVETLKWRKENNCNGSFVSHLFI